MNAIGNVSAKETMLVIQLRSLFVVYTDRKVLSNYLQMDSFAIRHPNLNRFAHTRQSFFIIARDIKFVFPRFHINRIGFQGQYGTLVLAIE
jgi:hypothetical protein